MGLFTTWKKAETPVEKVAEVVQPNADVLKLTQEVSDLKTLLLQRAQPVVQHQEVVVEEEEVEDEPELDLERF